MLFWTLMLSFIAGLLGLAVYLYFFYAGQFDDEENIKYQLFHEENSPD